MCYFIPTYLNYHNVYGSTIAAFIEASLLENRNAAKIRALKTTSTTNEVPQLSSSASSSSSAVYASSSASSTPPPPEPAAHHPNQTNRLSRQYLLGGIGALLVAYCVAKFLKPAPATAPHSSAQTRHDHNNVNTGPRSRPRRRAIKGSAVVNRRR